MSQRRAHIVIPEDLLAQVDALVGQRGRSAFLTEVIRREVNRRRLLEILGIPEPLLKQEDYPEFREGGVAFERKLREQDQRRDEEVLGGWLPSSS